MVIFVGGGILNGCFCLIFIFWECNRDVFNIIDLNFISCLLYFFYDVKCFSIWKNVIELGGVVQIIVLKNEKCYLCLKVFMVNKIFYICEFMMKIIFGKVVGWQMIIFFFFVQIIIDKDGNWLVFFMVEGDGIWKCFWFCELQVDGIYKDVIVIEVNKLYLIVMFNVEEYVSEYCILGNVIFEVDNVFFGEILEIVFMDGGVYFMYGIYDWVIGI